MRPVSFFGKDDINAFFFNICRKICVFIAFVEAAHPHTFSLQNTLESAGWVIWCTIQENPSYHCRLDKIFDDEPNWILCINYMIDFKNSTFRSQHTHVCKLFQPFISKFLHQGILQRLCFLQSADEDDHDFIYESLYQYSQVCNVSESESQMKGMILSRCHPWLCQWSENRNYLQNE